MRRVSIIKDIVGSDFKGYDHIVFSIVKYNNGQVGKIVLLYDTYAEIKNLATDDIDKVNYASITDVLKNGRKPELSLAHIERKIINTVNYYRKNPVEINGTNYWITDTADLTVNFETTTLRSKPSCMGTASVTGSKLQISFLVPFLQYAPAKEINEAILHEVAHLIAPKKEGHGPLWKAICTKIGGVANYMDSAGSYLEAMRDQAGPADVYLPGSNGRRLLESIVDLLGSDDFNSIVVPIIKDRLQLNYSAKHYGKLLITDDWLEFRDLLETVYKLINKLSTLIDNIDEDYIVDNLSYSDADILYSLGYEIKSIIKYMPTVFSMFKLED